MIAADPVAPAPANPTPCGACPWRLSNHGRRHPDGWYTKANLRRLWTGLRTGRAPGMSCHPTDPNNPLPAGWPKVKPDTVLRECRGAQILQTREWAILDRIANLTTGSLNPEGYGRSPIGFRVYRRLRPRGLTADGIGVLLEQEMFAGTGFSVHANKITQPVDLTIPVGIDGDALPWPVPDEAIQAVAVKVRR